MNTNLKLLMLLVQVVACLHYSESSPLLNDVSPCDLFYGEDDTDVTLFCDERHTTLEQIKNALNSLKDEGTIEVELYQVNLGTIPSDFFKGHNIKVLTIAFCDLDSLSGGGGRPLEGLENTLEVLMIKGSSVDEKEFRDSALSRFKNLREISLHSNKFREIGNDWFRDAPVSLSTIWLSGNGIQSLGDRVFSDIHNLANVFLDGNSFGEISRSMFPNPANKLYRLELDDNKLVDIPSDLFSNMPSLEKVSFSGNHISTLPEKVWRPIWNRVKEIDLSENPLKCDSHINWMTREPTCAKISADCFSPSGKNLPLLRNSNC